MNPAGFSKPRGWLLDASHEQPPPRPATRPAGQGKGTALAAELADASTSTPSTLTPSTSTDDEPTAIAPPIQPATLNGIAADDPFRLADLFLEKPQFRHPEASRLRFWDSQFAHWKDGAFDRLKEADVRGELSDFAEREFMRLHNEAAAIAAANAEKGAPTAKPTAKNKVSTALTANIIAALQSRCRIPSHITPPAWAYGDGPDPCAAIVTRNGILDLAAYVNDEPGAFIQASPRFLTLNRTNFDFNPNAPTPRGWLRFLETIWPADPESIKCLQEWFGYLLTPDTSLQKMLMLIGPPRAGKGTIGRILRQLVGERNIAAPTLASLAENFGLADLLDKTVAIIADARLSGRADAVAVTEQLLCISGEDQRTINRKYLPGTVAKLNTRFVFFSNELPRFGDSSAAIVSRLVILRLTETFVGREDTGLLDRLAPELPGILLWAIDGWKRLRITRRFTAPASAAELIEDAENLASPVKLWVSEDCELREDAATATGELFTSWVEWCKRHGRDKPGSQELLIRDLRAAFPTLRKVRAREGTSRQYVYAGIRPLSAMERGEVEI